MHKIIIVFILLVTLISFSFIPISAQVTTLPTGYETIVYRSGSHYYTQSQNSILIDSAVPDIAIKTALNQGGDIYIAGGIYNLSTDFSGFDLKSNTHLKLAQDTQIVVPSGYNGYVFRFNSGTAYCVMEGGHIYEADPVKRSWIGILMQGGHLGVKFNYIENVTITNPYIVIDFNAETGQWINANTFVNIRGEFFVRGIEFDFKGNHIYSDGFNGNIFRDSQFESGTMTTYGAKDIQRENNAFYNVQFWDLPLTANSSTIDPSAKNTIIIGGIMTTYYGFVDHGKNTIILDAWHNNPPSNSTISSSLINKGAYLPVQNETYADPILGSVSESNSTLLTSMRVNAKLWSQDEISDATFENKIQNLVNIGILEKPNSTQTSSQQSLYIPDWFKNNAGFWSDGQISDNDFISAIQYLLDNGMIRIQY